MPPVRDRGHLMLKDLALLQEEEGEPVLVVLDLDVVLDLTSERPVKRLPAKLLTEYRSSGLHYALVGLGGLADPVLAGLPQVPVLGSELTPVGRAKVVEEARCSRPGVYVVSQESAVCPGGWGLVVYQPTDQYHLLVHRIWAAAPPPPPPTEESAT